MFGQRSLKTQLIIFFILFAVIPAAVGGAISIYMNVTSTKNSTIQSNSNTTLQIAKQIEIMLDDSKGMTEGLAASPTARSLDGAVIRDMIVNFQQKNPQFELIYVMDKTGMQVARTAGTLANRGDRPYFVEAMKGSTFFTDVYISSFTNAPSVTISVPIKDAAGKSIGVFAADIGLQALWSIAENVKVGKNGYVEIVDHNGVVIAYPDHEKVLKKESFAELEYVKKVIGGQTGSMDSISSRGDTTIATFSPVNKYKWGVIVNEPLKDVHNGAVSASYILMAILLISLLLAAVTAFYIARSIVSPLQKVVDSVQLVAGGDLSQALVAEGALEVNQLVRGVNHMMSALREMISHASSVSESVAASAEELTASATEVGRASEEVAITIQDVAQSATNQVQLSDESAAIMTEMQSGIADAVEAACDVSGASERSEQSAEHGLKQVNHAVMLMSSIQEDVGNAAQKINALGEKSRQIGQIVEVITNIAGQTNLLALNAAIEAARAGEQGRGFAVVADEVRKLAEQSQEAAKEIAEIIGAIQSETIQAVEAMDKGSHEVVEGVKVVSASKVAFEEIYVDVKEMRKRVEKILVLMDTQLTGSGQVGQSINGIADASRTNAASSQEVAAASEEQNASVHEIVTAVSGLATMASELQEVVHKFKV
ncbi:methyl-accepting chemotaxis protein [Pelosinus sp. UFO1]|uniref:methyl-accepting chemotaxis protein n=1 Tax=Pelosinus sp. UFO1 TaxID=484770 RepID=UPI0004D0CDF0|nr:methyl-accepting chemotaxis protein [Pelosinus sp. UFO1]AIF52599.1 methyl-accepting chemotaxis sensory transducer with Cache sensor [Pelosinus sp. UFO1]